MSDNESVESDTESNVESYKKYYNYKGGNILKLNINKNLFEDKVIKLCAFNIINKQIPFINFLLINNKYNKLSFPSIPLIRNYDSEQLIEYAKIFLFSLLTLPDFEKFNELIEFNGFFEYDNTIYLFIDMTKYEYNAYDIYKNSTIWFTLIDEIMHHRNLCNMPIDEEVRTLLINNNDLYLLEDENKENYEIPVVGYISVPGNKLEFTYMFGSPKSDKNGILGPYFYFTDFNNAFNEGCQYIKGGIVRFAIFMDSVKYIENFPNDPIDESEIKQMRLNDDNLDNRLEQLTMRISDHDGNWAQKYSSVYLADVELDDGTKYDKKLLVIKEYEQQIPLSYHYVNKKSLNDSKNYSIL